MRRDSALKLLLLGIVFVHPALAQSASVARPQRVYYIAFLKRDPARKPISKEEGERIQSAHMANIQSMADRGLLVAAGPFDDTPAAISGVFFFATSTLDEARKVAEADPTVVDVMAWRGPGGIGEEYKRLHKQNPDTPAGMGVHPFIILRRADKPPDDDLSGKHSAYLAGLRSGGKIVAAGPVVGDPSAAEIIIFDRIPDEEASTLIAADPAVGSGSLAAETHRWWCAANVFPR